MADAQPQRDPRRTSKFDRHLAENALFAMSGQGKDVKEIVHRTTATIDGRVVPQLWKVTPNAVSGFGSQTILGTFYELIQIWVEQGTESRQIEFGTIYNLLKRKGSRQFSKKDYDRIKRDLDALVGLVIDSENIFWDADNNELIGVLKFHLFDSVFYFKEQPGKPPTLPMGYIRLSEEFFSIGPGNLFTLDFGRQFFHSLKPSEQIMALHLGKMLKRYSTYRCDLLKFANQVGINVAHRRNIRQRIKLIVDGLQEKGFDLVKSYRFEKNGQNGEHVVFLSTREPRRQAALGKGRGEKPPDEVERLVSYMLDVLEDEQSERYYRKVAARLPAREIERMLGEAKLAYNERRTANKGRLFVHLVKDYAQANGLEL